MPDMVNNPPHYVEQSVTVEPINILRFAPFDLGNALKYMIRAGHKDDELLDLRKAEYYLKCSLESYCHYTKKPYKKFFRRYGNILNKFRGIPYLFIEEWSVNDILEHLCLYVRNSIIEVENRKNED